MFWPAFDRAGEGGKSGLRVFLSYHTPDRTIALSLKRAIEDTLRGVDVFVDQTHLRHGHLWQPSLFDAIAKAEAFLILVSNRAGDWQKFEYYEALDRKVKDAAFVLLPVIIADRAKGPAANLPGLAQLHWIESTEPTAPDPLSRIVAALNDIDPQAWLADVLARLRDHPAKRIGELLPWNWRPRDLAAKAARQRSRSAHSYPVA